MPETTRSGFPITEHDALNEIPSGVGVFDVTDSMVEMEYLNDGFYRMIGARREDRARFFKTGTINSVHPDDRPGLLAEALLSVREHRMFEYRFRNLDGAGNYMWIGIRASHRPLDEKTERFFASYYNVDNYISEQDLLKSHNNDVDKILGSVPGGIAVFSHHDGEIRVEFANNGFYELHHGSREFWRNKSQNPVDWLIEEDRDEFLNAFTRLREGGASQGSASYRITGEDGNYHWVGIQFRFAFLRDDIPYYYASFTGLDELKAAEQSRTEARRMYEAAVEEANLVVWEFDIPSHRIVMAENEFTRYDYRKFGLPKVTEDAPRALIPYIDDLSVDTFLEMYRQVEAGAPRASCEVWYKLKPGTEPRCERISYTTAFDDDGRPIKAYGIGQNITRQKLAQEEYDRLREQLTGNLMDVVGSFQLDLSENRYLGGYSPFPGMAELLERETADAHFAATAETVVSEKIRREILQEYTCENLITLFKSGLKQLDKEYPVRTSSGGIIWVHSTLHMMQNPNTGDVEGITYSKDVTGQKRNGEIIRKLANEGCDYIGVIDVVDRSFEMHTQNWDCDTVAVGQRLGYDTVREMLTTGYIASVGRSAFIEATSLDFVITVLGEKAQHVVAYDYSDAPGSERLLKKQVVFSWLNSGKREILCIQQDVTEAYQREQEQIVALEKAKREADAANEAKSVFLSGMSHDLRTPLNGVLGFAAFAMNERDPEKKQEYLEKIDASGRLLLDLVNDTLELSRIESGKVSIEREAVSQRDLIPAVATALRPSAELKGIGYHTDFDIDDALLVWCDKLKTQKIALNLISNAIKYTQENGDITVALKMVPAKGEGLVYHLVVADTGIGMSEEFMKRMYEPFSQEMRPEAYSAGGTGLGLAIVKRTVELLGGTIDVKSEQGKGTRFMVEIPISVVDEPEAMQAPARADDDLSGRRVLLCEDNQLNREIAETLLRNKGIVDESAENGRIGLDLFAASQPEKFDAVLMDLRMPVMDGYEAAKAIRALDRPDAGGVPIIALTADAFEESAKEAVAAGMNGHLAKPVIPERLYASLAEAIASRE